MFDSLLPNLQHGEPILSISLKAYVLENDMADELWQIQDGVTDVTIGSYPFDEEGKIKGTCLVATSRNAAKLATVKNQLQALIDSKLSLPKNIL
jgi:molybdopterin-biosynthesis enzyme MoeA-like protein